MKYHDINTYNALVAAPDDGLAERKFVSFFVRSLDGNSTAMFGFWNDLDTVTASVLRGDTGVAEARQFYGDGSLLDVEPVVLTSNLTVQTLRINLSQIHETVQNMVRGHDIRGAKVEIHRGIFNPKTNALAGPIYCRFIGKVNKAPIGTPRIRDEGSVQIEVSSITRELTRTNPAKKSDETQKRRSGDGFRRYAGVANIPVWWGGASSRTNPAVASPGSSINPDRDRVTDGGHR